MASILFLIGRQASRVWMIISLDVLFFSLCFFFFQLDEYSYTIWLSCRKMCTLLRFHSSSWEMISLASKAKQQVISPQTLDDESIHWHTNKTWSIEADQWRSWSKISCQRFYFPHTVTRGNRRLFGRVATPANAFWWRKEEPTQK